jgi:hypothetical protein
LKKEKQHLVVLQRVICFVLYHFCIFFDKKSLFKISVCFVIFASANLNTARASCVGKYKRVFVRSAIFSGFHAVAFYFDPHTTRIFTIGVGVHPSRRHSSREKKGARRSLIRKDIKSKKGPAGKIGHART